ncbi:MAG: response regulator [Nitrospirae bacterium]|nr:response regulator [Nitrospirota bacterium]
MKEKILSILVIDDDSDILKAIYDLLCNTYDIYSATSVDNSFAVVTNKRIDLILSDQQLPESMGVRLLSLLDHEHLYTDNTLVVGYSDMPIILDYLYNGSIDTSSKLPWLDVMLILSKALVAGLNKARDMKKVIESQARHAARLALLGELMVGILHEINNPLSVINGNLDNLMTFFNRTVNIVERVEESCPSEDFRTSIQKIKEEVKYDYMKTRVKSLLEQSRNGFDTINTIIRRIKTFSRIDTTDLSEVSIHEVLETSLALILNKYKHTIDIVKDYGTLPPLECCAIGMSQVFTNLLVNACHAMDGEGKITIRTSYADDVIKIDISDTGKGIPQGDMTKIFNSFYTTKPDGQGTGLGLSISQNIVRQHKGEILVQSVMGQGTTFTIKLPCE